MAPSFFLFSDFEQLRYTPLQPHMLREDPTNAWDLHHRKSIAKNLQRLEMWLEELTLPLPILYNPSPFTCHDLIQTPSCHSSSHDDLAASVSDEKMEDVDMNEICEEQTLPSSSPLPLSLPRSLQNPLVTSIIPLEPHLQGQITQRERIVMPSMEINNTMTPPMTIAPTVNAIYLEGGCLVMLDTVTYERYKNTPNQRTESIKCKLRVLRQTTQKRDREEREEREERERERIFSKADINTVPTCTTSSDDIMKILSSLSYHTEEERQFIAANYHSIGSEDLQAKYVARLLLSKLSHSWYNPMATKTYPSGTILSYETPHS